MTSNEQTSTVPNMWETLKTEGPDLGLSGLLNVWTNRLRTAKSENDQIPKTIICVTFAKMVNLIPQDAPNPLYSSDYLKTTDQFILDHLCMEELNAEDSELENSEGKSLQTISGKEIVFKKDSDSKITVNSIDVESVKALSDGTQIFIIKEFLFDHYENTQKCFKQISADVTSEFCPLSNS